ncbi:hypothetical protein X797_008280 [Metarhizium robertsii]|uniref:Uncharacterized protein n=2 Tax=Metarhizium robertsii TaxID=568076 RepID=E9F7F4_METRA|nr:uncharacterized protein MAA_08203 [Metarhizium robertsii ARSEF 23]EFY96291.1 hypothetical protein MAA_08203 [Metarhizium robertsii ARSEF 23]EXU98566.1 hypothetical protein X797_008280 [Metarhizium robertsii]
MKGYAIIFLIQALTAGVLACDCDYHPGGCTISKAPPAGWKCKCRYKGAWTCDGLQIQCDATESCPVNCFSRACCLEGGGDCGGY